MFKNKYIKYKKKYLNLKKQLGGMEAAAASTPKKIPQALTKPPSVKDSYKVAKSSIKQFLINPKSVRNLFEGYNEIVKDFVTEEPLPGTDETNIVNLKLCSFNCQGHKLEHVLQAISRIQRIVRPSSLFLHPKCHIILLQEIYYPSTEEERTTKTYEDTSDSKEGYYKVDISKIFDCYRIPWFGSHGGRKDYVVLIRKDYGLTLELKNIKVKNYLADAAVADATIADAAVADAAVVEKHRFRPYVIININYMHHNFNIINIHKPSLNGGIIPLGLIKLQELLKMPNTIMMGDFNNDPEKMEKLLHVMRNKNLLKCVDSEFFHHKRVSIDTFTQDVENFFKDIPSDKSNKEQYTRSVIAPKMATQDSGRTLDWVILGDDLKDKVIGTPTIKMLNFFFSDHRSILLDINFDFTLEGEAAADSPNYLITNGKLEEAAAAGPVLSTPKANRKRNLNPSSTNEKPPKQKDTKKTPITKHSNSRSTSGKGDLFSE